MLSPNHYNNPERNPKNINPSSPSLKRKNLDYTMHVPMPTANIDYPRKDINAPLSPQGHYYKPDKSTTFTSNYEPSL